LFLCSFETPRTQFLIFSATFSQLRGPAPRRTRPQEDTHRSCKITPISVPTNPRTTTRAPTYCTIPCASSSLIYLRPTNKPVIFATLIHNRDGTNACLTPVRTFLPRTHLPRALSSRMHQPRPRTVPPCTHAHTHTHTHTRTHTHTQMGTLTLSHASILLARAR